MNVLPTNEVNLSKFLKKIIKSLLLIVTKPRLNHNDCISEPIGFACIDSCAVVLVSCCTTLFLNWTNILNAE